MENRHNIRQLIDDKLIDRDAGMMIFAKQIAKGQWKLPNGSILERNEFEDYLIGILNDEYGADAMWEMHDHITLTSRQLALDLIENEIRNWGKGYDINRTTNYGEYLQLLEFDGITDAFSASKHTHASVKAKAAMLRLGAGSAPRQ